MEFNDFVNAVLHGGAITLTIFILLVVLSVVTWGIIIGKIVQLRKEDQNSGKFVKEFNKAKLLKSFLYTNRKRAPVDYDLGILFDEIIKPFNCIFFLFFFLNSFKIYVDLRISPFPILTTRK